MLTLTPYEKEEALQYWKAMLGLDVWRIHVTEKPAMEIDGVAAQARWVLSRRIAQIIFCQLGTGEDHGICVEHQDDEASLVHELLHLAFAVAHETIGDTSDIVDNVAMEQPIELLAELLVRLRRAGPEKLSFDDRTL